MLTLLQQDTIHASVKDEGRIIGRRVETSNFLRAVWLIYTDSDKAFLELRSLSLPATASKGL